MYIYAIISPLTGNPVYIGRTVGEPKYRLALHKQDARVGSISAKPLTLWIRAMNYLGVSSEIKIIQIAKCESKEEAVIIEDDLIEKYMKLYMLLNVTRLSGKKSPKLGGGIIMDKNFVPKEWKSEVTKLAKKRSDGIKC